MGEKKMKHKDRKFSLIMTDVDDMGKIVDILCINFHQKDDSICCFSSGKEAAFFIALSSPASLFPI